MSGTLRPIFTAAYASPEQIDGADDLDIRSDLYSLGVTLWHCLVGHPTFGNTSQQKAVVGHLSKEPPFGELHAAGVPTPFVALLVRLLAKDPADRPASPEALLEVLDGLLSGNGETAAPPPVAPPPPEPVPEPAATDHSFTLAEVLRQRGVLPPAEAWTLLEAVAPLVDDAWNGGPGGEVTAPTAAAGGDLDPARIRVRLAEPPPPPGSLCELPGRPVGEWPECTLELDAAEERYPMGFGHTRPGPRGRAALGPAGALAALGCELIGGQPPAPGPWRPLSALDEAGNNLLREALRADSRFRSATELAGAFGVSIEVAPPPPLPLPLGQTPHLVPEAENPLELVKLAIPTRAPDWLTSTFGLGISAICRGVSYRDLKQFTRVVAEFTKAVALDPKDATAYSGRGNAYNSLNQFERAVADCT